MGETTLRLAVFDVDGTLVDSQHTIVAAMRTAFTGERQRPPEPSAVRFIGKARLEGGAGHRAVVFPAAGHDRTLGEHPADGNRKPNMSSNRVQRDKPFH